MSNELPTSWKKAQALSTILVSVLIPLVIAFLGHGVNKSIKDNELSLSYIQLAIGILKDEPKPGTENLRAWAIDIVNNYSSVKLTTDAKEELKGNPLPSIESREEDPKKRFGLDNHWRPLEDIENEFEDQGDVIVDHATGLMWQKSGSHNRMPYQEVQEYIDELNRIRFAGYDDWRLPTLKELMTLVEREEDPINKLYINPIFDSKQKYCWSADLFLSGAAWTVYFHSRHVIWNSLKNSYYVRCVRS